MSRGNYVAVFHLNHMSRDIRRLSHTQYGSSVILTTNQTQLIETFFTNLMLDKVKMKVFLKKPFYNS